MSKRICIMILFAISIIFTITFLFLYVVPFKTMIYIDAVPGTDDSEIIKWADELNANYVYIDENPDCTTYVLQVKAPLMKILKTDKFLENPNITDIVYGWELKKPISPMYTHM